MEITETSLKTKKPDYYHEYSIYKSTSSKSGKYTSYAFSIGVQAPSDWGVDILACHKFAQCPNAQVLKLGYKHTQTALKSNTFAIPAFNETTIILKVVIFKLVYSVTTI